MNWKPIDLDDKQLFDRYFSARRYENSWFTFTNLFIWRDTYQPFWNVKDDVLRVRFALPEGLCLLPPFVLAGGDFPSAVDAIAADVAAEGKAFRMWGLSPEMVQELGSAAGTVYQVNPQRDRFDYVYRVSELRDLAGRKFHGKKNHLNRFRAANPDGEYVPITVGCIDDCLAVAVQWCGKRECDYDVDLMNEHAAIREGLTHFEALGLSGGMIRIKGKPEAFSFGEPLNEDTAVVHVEKADPEIPGLFVAINQACCEFAWNGAEFVNREEDLGSEGLRKAKESYNPVKLVEKFELLKY